MMRRLPLVTATALIALLGGSALAQQAVPQPVPVAARASALPAT